MSSSGTRYAEIEGGLTLESGRKLAPLTIAYRSWGRLNAARDNAVMICHALTGSPDADMWWRGLIGPGRALDPAHDFILCSNVLGGCDGTTGPASTDPATGHAYGPSFPAITVRDMVHAQALLLDHLNVKRLALVIGGSLGGMQVLEWGALYPERVAALAPIATSARHSAWCIGFSEAQRQAIYADAHWRNGRYTRAQPPASGLAAARMIAMCTYRHWQGFAERFGREQADDGQFQVEHYLQYQGAKLAERFDANAYVTLTRAMDSHDIGRARCDWRDALAAIEQPALVVAIDTDVLYPPSEQRDIAAGLAHSELAWLSSRYGHDGFLVEMRQLSALVLKFRNSLTRGVPAAQPLRSAASG